MVNLFKNLFGRKRKANVSSAQNGLSQIPKGQKSSDNKTKRPREINLGNIPYVPLPPSPPVWEVDGREEFHEVYSHPELGPVIQAEMQGKYKKVIDLAKEFSAEQCSGRVAQAVAKAYRQLIQRRRKSGSLKAAANLTLGMIERVSNEVTNTDRRRFNKILSEMEKKGARHKFQKIPLEKEQDVPLFALDGGIDWDIIEETKLRPEEKPDTGYRDYAFTAHGILLIGHQKKSDDSPYKAGILKYDKLGGRKTEQPLKHDIYREGVNPAGDYFALSDSECNLFVYDSNLCCVKTINLPSDQRVVSHYSNIDTDYWGEHKSHIRTVGVSPDGSRVFFSIADEAWCINRDDDTIWGVCMPLNEGWERAVGRSQRYGASQDVERSLQEFAIKLPVSAEQIKKRYKELVLKYHPDRNSDSPSAQDKMVRINEAFEILTGVDPKMLNIDSGDKTFFRRTGPDEVFEADGFRIEMTLTTGYAQDWVYSFCTSADNEHVYLGSYSGKIVQLTGKGKAVRIIDLGTAPQEIVDTGSHLYLLTPTRLYILDRNCSLLKLIDVFKKGRLVVSTSGFGLVSSKALTWFKPSGERVGAVKTKDPIRAFYSRNERTIIETRRHRAIISGLDLS